MEEQKQTIKLRGHHIDLLKSKLSAEVGLIARGLSKILLRVMYNGNFYKKYNNFFKELSSDSEIEVVSGLDDMCNMGCPNYHLCSERKYDEVAEKMGRKLGPFSNFLKPAEGFDVDSNDKRYLDMYGLEVGEKYALEDILER